MEVAKEARPENPEIWTDEEGEISFKIPKRTPKKQPEDFIVSFLPKSNVRLSFKI